MNPFQSLNFLKRRKKGLGVGFVDMVRLARPTKAKKISEVRDWQEVFLPQDRIELSDGKIGSWVAVVLGLAVASIMIIFLSRLWELQIVRGQSSLQASDGNRMRIRVIPAPRGVIYDRNGLSLVTNSPGFRLVAETIGVSGDRLTQLSDNLATDLGMAPAEIMDKLRDQGTGESRIKSGLTRDQALNLELKLKDYPELRVVEDPIRVYPNGVTLSHLLGYIGEISPEELSAPKYLGYRSGDKLGRTGIEEAYDYLLRGQDGRELVEVDALGRTERVVAREEPVAGRNIVLTVDLNLTKTLEQELIRHMARVNSKKGAVVATDPRNGSILAYISWPGFDPNLFSRGISDEQYATLLEDPNRPLFDRVISGTYPPGSTFKPTVSVAALSEGVTSRTRLINSPGVVYLGTQAFRNWTPAGFGMQSIVDAIAYSNDIYFYYMGGELGADRLTGWARKLGFGEPSGIKIPGEVSGTTPTTDWKEETIGEIWYPGDNYNYGIGQGYLLVTPLQLVGSISAIGNGGSLYQPILIKEVRDSSNLVVSQDNPVLRRGNLVAADVNQIVKEGMKKACTLFVNLAGDTGCKTGSAEFGDDNSHALFVAFAPWESPEIALAVLVEGGGHGSQIAAPVTRPVLQKYLNK